MKKIILSAVVASMALTTTASALEDIKVNGQAKLWYENNNKGSGAGTSLFDSEGGSGEVVFKLGVTGKQGNVGFGATVYQTSTFGLENNLVSGVRTDTTTTTFGEMYAGEMYITIPTVASTTLKIGKQELQTPLAYTEKWNATPNTFNAAVAINKSFENLTLVGAYVGQTNAQSTALTATTTASVNHKTAGEVDNAFYDGAFAAVAHYKNNSFAVNGYYYNVQAVADAGWLDASTTIAGVKASVIAAKVSPKGVAEGQDDTTAYAISAGTKVAGVNLSAAYSTVSDKGYFAVGNTATKFKKTKLPTAGVYTDGLYVAQPGSDAFKIKAATKLAGTGIALQYIDNDNNANGGNTGYNGYTSVSRDTQEIDLILSKKLGDVNMKAILLDRSFDDAATDASTGGQHLRIIASVDF